MKQLYFVLFLFLSLSSLAQRNQTIKGTVVDAETKQPLVGATVFVETPEIVGASVDVNGKFKIENVAVGRLEVKATYIGYEPWSSGLITITSGKEFVLQIALEENV
ncbi:MAG: carboxypeptidase regulatory-like domain-containing protein, partial [Flavobacteriales bacterium]